MSMDLQPNQTYKHYISLDIVLEIGNLRYTYIYRQKEKLIQQFSQLGFVGILSSTRNAISIIDCHTILGTSLYIVEMTRLVFSCLHWLVGFIHTHTHNVYEEIRCQRSTLETKEIYIMRCKLRFSKQYVCVCVDRQIYIDIYLHFLYSTLDICFISSLPTLYINYA